MTQTRDHDGLNQANYDKNAEVHNQFGIDATLYLAYRDLPGIIRETLVKKSPYKQHFRIMDFGCGAGLSTQCVAKIFTDMGYTTEIVGVDVNQQNLACARERVPQGDFYCVTNETPLDHLGSFDLIICNFVLVEIKSEEMNSVLNRIQSSLSDIGVAIVSNCNAHCYKRGGEWYSFKNDFSENEQTASKNGKPKFTEDQKVTVELETLRGSGKTFRFFDYFHSGAAYRAAYETAGLQLIKTHKPLGLPTDGFSWKSETNHSPYKIHILEKRRDLYLELEVLAETRNNIVYI